MSRRPKILAIAGSPRTNSYSTRVLKTAVRGAEAAGAEVTLYDLREHPMPLYTPEAETAGFDPNALELQRLLVEHDALLIASPEYNGSITAVLKNALDWASRPSGQHDLRQVYRNKLAGILTASPGSFGGLRALGHLRGVLTSVGATVLPTEIAVSFVDGKFDGEGETMTDAKMRGILEKLGAELAETAACRLQTQAMAQAS